MATTICLVDANTIHLFDANTIYLDCPDVGPEPEPEEEESRPGGRLPLGRRGPYWSDEGPEHDAHRERLLREDDELLVLI